MPRCGIAFRGEEWSWDGEDKGTREGKAERSSTYLGLEQGWPTATILAPFSNVPCFCGSEAPVLP